MKTRNKLTVIVVTMIALALGVLCTACTSESSVEYPDLGGVGLDEIVTMTLPDGYSERKSGGDSFLPTGECIQKSWGSDDGVSEIWAEILVYDGVPIMVDPTSIEEFVADQEVEIKDKFYIVSGYADDTNVEDSMLTAYTQYGKYLLGFEISSYKALTKKEKKKFYKMLKTIEFKPVPED